MRLILTLFLVVPFALGALVLFFAWKLRELPARRNFFWLSVAALVYIGCYALEINSDTFRFAKLWYDIEHAVIPFELAFLLLVCHDYTCADRPRWLWIFTYVYPAAYLLVYFTNGLTGLFARAYSFESNGSFPVIAAVRGPGFYASLLPFAFVSLYCLYLNLRALSRAARLHRTSYILMAVASLLPGLSILFAVLIDKLRYIDVFAFVTVLATFLFTLGIFRYHIFSAVPIATEMAFRLSEDAIAILDAKGRLADANDAFRALFASGGAHPGLDELRGAEGPLPFQIGEGDGARHYTARHLSIPGVGGESLGEMISIKDVTQYAQRLQRLDALAADAMARAQEKELSFLQAQISPHFLNNTLGTIAAMIGRDDAAAKALVVDLSEYLIQCYREEGDAGLLPLSRELEAVETYVRIIRARFGDRLDFAVENALPPALLLPRLVLQPLVENAVRHGVLPKGGGKVRLRIREAGGFARVTVSDDGVGMEPARVPALLSGAEPRQGIGIVNIHNRLLKWYGHGLEIDTAPGAGTRVCFQVPLEKGGSA